MLSASDGAHFERLDGLGGALANAVETKVRTAGAAGPGDGTNAT